MTFSFGITRQPAKPLVKKIACIMAFGLAIVWPTQLMALPKEASITQEAEPPTVVTLRPAGEPVPALRYRFVSEPQDLVAGNAALFYHRACQMLILDRGYRMAENLRDPARKQPLVDTQVSEWVYRPIEEIPRDKALSLLEKELGRIMNEVEQGTSRASCDWEFEGRKEGIWLLLPEMQEIRTLARLVAVRARVAILDGKTDEAMHWIKTGLTMGQHVARGPFMVQVIVGISIDSLMNQCLLELVQASGTPSLFWVLADRPRPLIDASRSFQGERYLLEKELPELKNLSSHVWSDDEARQFADVLQRKLFSFSSEQSQVAPGTPEDTASFGRRLKIASMAAGLYPEATRFLVTQGWAESKVKAMPVIQVATLYTYIEYTQMRDETYKWLNVPYHQSFEKLDQSMKSAMSDKLKNPMLVLFNQLRPALDSQRMSLVRLERDFDALQVIEAIRLYAHKHQGKMPTSLEAMSESPVPRDPATGKPFDYKLSGDSATLKAPKIPGGPDAPQFKINYLLKLAR